MLNVLYDLTKSKQIKFLFKPQLGVGRWDIKEGRFQLFTLNFKPPFNNDVIII